MSNYIDNFTRRVFNLNNKTLVVNVQGTLPIMITNQTFLSNSNLTFKCITNNISLTDDLILTNTDGTDRTIYIGSAQSPLTYNIILFYYDLNHNDILILPNLEGYKLAPNGKCFQVPAMRLGGGAEFKLQTINQLVDSSTSSSYKIPETNSNVSITTYLTTIPGIPGAESDKGGVYNRFEEMVDDVHNIYHTIRNTGIIIDLGKSSTLFTSSGNIPLYLLHQVSIINYGIDYLGVKNPSDNNLYITLKF